MDFYPITILISIVADSGTLVKVSVCEEPVMMLAQPFNPIVKATIEVISNFFIINPEEFIYRYLKMHYIKINKNNN